MPRRLLLRIIFVLSACLMVVACSGSEDDGKKKVSAGSGATAKTTGDSKQEVGGSGGELSEGGRTSTSDVEAGYVEAGSGSSRDAGSPRGGSGAGGSGGTKAQDAAEATSCDPPLPSELVGWAAVEGNGVSTTTGGGDAKPLVITTLAELSSSIAGTQARVIHIQGNIKGSVSVGSNKTLVGVCGGTISGHISVSGSVNVIIRNLKIVGNNCSDSPNDCSGGADAVSVNNGAHHVWFDHCDISDGSDGNFDITNGSDFVTVSYTKFSYSSARSDPAAGKSGHRFSNLIGSGDNVPADVGHLNVTFHHNWWADNVNQRMPRTRRGKIHVFNNLFTSAGNSYCTNAGFEAAVRVERNVYIDVNSPLMPDDNSVGLESIENEFINTTGNAEGLRSSFVPPYEYVLDPTDSLSKTLREQVGPQ
jgi:pectate lyase